MPDSHGLRVTCFLAASLLAITTASGEQTTATATKIIQAAQQPAAPETHSVRINLEAAELQNASETTLPEWARKKSISVSESEGDALIKALVSSKQAKLLSANVAELETGRPVDVYLSYSSSFPSGGSISIGGDLEYQTRHQDIALRLDLIDATRGQVSIDLTLRQMRFLGFMEYAAQTTNGVAASTGFFQPVFDTTSHDIKLALQEGQVAVLRVDWPDKSTALGDAKDRKGPPVSDPNLAAPHKPMLIFLRLFPQR